MNKKMINSKIRTAILNLYGTRKRYFLDASVKDYICYCDIQNPGALLTIDLKYKKDTYEPYIEVRLSDNKGRIIQTDQFEVLFDGTELYQISTHKKDKDIEYINEQIAYIGTTNSELPYPNQRFKHGFR